MSLIETIVNTIIGFLLSLFVVWPLVSIVLGLEHSAKEDFLIVTLFTVVSIIRGYVIRRWFETKIHGLSAWITEFFDTEPENSPTRIVKKYVLFPGWIRSRSDNQRHYISYVKLANLYGVDLKECIVMPDVDSPQYHTELQRLADMRELIMLHPQYDGNYTISEVLA
jgi:hypothetical protein